MKLKQLVVNARNNVDLIGEARHIRSVKALQSLAGPAVRGLLFQIGKASDSTEVPASHSALFDWGYERNRPDLARLYEAAKSSQWNATTDLDWSQDVDPFDPERELLPEALLPLAQIPAYRRMNKREQANQRLLVMSWLLSQFLHGEQAALFAACQVTESVQWLDGKLYGSTQVVDEGRHVEVFSRYLDEKLEKTYAINDNLYVLVDSLLSDARWDIKFLGMQIMIEGLALGAFGIMRQQTKEPLLRELLRYVITDEARHVHYGVLALEEPYRRLPERERREREDWAYEVTVLMRNRFLVHEVYEENYAHLMSRRAWNRLVMESPFMLEFRKMMFKRLIPNLKRIGLLSDRIRPHYQSLGLLAWEHEKSAPELTADDLLRDSA